MTQNPPKEPMTDLITQSLAHFAAHHGDPYAPAYEALYAHDAAYEGLFLLDTDEGLRRNMMQTTLEIITTYLSDREAAANRIVGARMSHIPYGRGWLGSTTPRGRRGSASSRGRRGIVAP